ncbi:MAG: prepilin-type N-terminal cleavage/methylation domain-containing protein [Phycisphaerales bacterium]|nr:prepilin-type N-terminal cleavage/methylation domain-containing protein [Phycisphaerales bacterium]
MMVRAFSLLELVVVVVIIGVIAAIAVPRMSGFAAGSKVQAAASSVRAMQEKVIEYQGLMGEWPSTIDPNWFLGGRIPSNPYAGNPSRGVQAVNGGAGVTEPTIKVVGGGKAAYWYNRDNGQVRVRVADLGNAAATIALYNAVNGTGVTALNQTVPESGGAPAESKGGGKTIVIELGG